jgi:hypothetical protein
MHLPSELVAEVLSFNINLCNYLDYFTLNKQIYNMLKKEFDQPRNIRELCDYNMKTFNDDNRDVNQQIMSEISGNLFQNPCGIIDVISKYDDELVYSKQVQHMTKQILILLCLSYYCRKSLADVGDEFYSASKKTNKTAKRILESDEEESESDEEESADFSTYIKIMKFLDDWKLDGEHKLNNYDWKRDTSHYLYKKIGNKMFYIVLKPDIKADYGYGYDHNLKIPYKRSHTNANDFGGVSQYKVNGLQLTDLAGHISGVMNHGDTYFCCCEFSFRDDGVYIDVTGGAGYYDGYDGEFPKEWEKN